MAYYPYFGQNKQIFPLNNQILHFIVLTIEKSTTFKPCPLKQIFNVYSVYFTILKSTNRQIIHLQNMSLFGQITILPSIETVKISHLQKLSLIFGDVVRSPLRKQ